MSKRPTESGDWSSDAEALFQSTRADHAPSAADRARVRSALARRLGDASSAPDAFAGEAASRVGLGKLALMGLGIVCAVVATFVFMRSSESPERPAPLPVASKLSVPAPNAGERVEPQPAQPSEDTSSHSKGEPPARLAPRRSRPRPVPAPALAHSAPKPAAAEPAARDQQSADAASTDAVARDSTPALASRSAQPSAAATAPRPVAQAAPAATEDEDSADARAELAFIARIQAATLEAKPRTVLTLCAEHERRWPHGTFVQEREGLRAIASCSAAMSDAATRARKFFASYPRAVIASRVREACNAQLTAAIGPAGAAKP